MKRLCPKCEASLRVKVLTDSDGEIYQKWLYCECGYNNKPPEYFDTCKEIEQVLATKE